MDDINPEVFIALNRRLALLVGWTDVTASGGHTDTARPAYEGYSPLLGKQRKVTIPDYCRDLNACSELERHTTQISNELSAWRQPGVTYEIALLDLCNPDEQLWDNGRYLGSFHHAGRAVRASALQKVLAFLVALGEDIPTELHKLCPSSWTNLA